MSTNTDLQVEELVGSVVCWCGESTAFNKSLPKQQGLCAELLGTCSIVDGVMRAQPSAIACLNRQARYEEAN